MQQFSDERIQHLIRDTRNKAEPAVRDGNRAELEAILVANLIHELRESSVLLHEGTRGLQQAIDRHRDILQRAAEESTVSANRLATLSEALVVATNRYVWLTRGIVLVAGATLLLQLTQWLAR